MVEAPLEANLSLQPSISLSNHSVTIFFLQVCDHQAPLEANLPIPVNETDIDKTKTDPTGVELTDVAQSDIAQTNINWIHVT